MPIIETSRLILRRWADEDAESLFRYAKDPAVGPAAGWPPHTSVKNSLEIIRTVFSEPETYAVVLKSTAEPIGAIGIVSDANRYPDGEAEIGYWMGKTHWGNGYMTEAAKALVEHGFNNLGLSCLWISHFDGNLRSRRVAEKCGSTYDHSGNEAITDNTTLSNATSPQIIHFLKLSSEAWQKQAYPHGQRGIQITL